MNTRRITSRSEKLRPYLKKTWSYRSMAWVLAKRDIKIKYAQSLVGIGWVVLQPLVAVAVYTIFFSRLLNLDTPYPYVLFVVSGVIFWSLFNYIFSQGSNALLQNQDLIRKLYFPRVLLPVSKVLVALTEFVIVFGLFVGLLIYYGIPLSIKCLVLVPVLLGTACFGLGLALLLSAATIRNRDLHHIVPFLVYFGIWLTPVFYPVTIIPSTYAKWLYVNPMTSYIQWFRWGFFSEPIDYFSWIGVLLGLLVCLAGILVFKAQEDKIADSV